jgi:CubicO group peptidase (beta-lactamase class C family)
MPDLEAFLVEALADGTGPGIAVAVVQAGGATRLAAAGLADPATGRPMTPDTPACTGSVSKTFTAAAVLRLRDGGRLALGDPVVRHLPEVAGFRDPFGAAATVTIRDLLRHLSGLPGEAPSPHLRAYDPAPIADVLANPGHVTWAIPPGSAFKYSNLGFELLGEIVARGSGEPYGAFVQRAILAPLGMASTTLDPDPALAARGHDPADDHGTRPQSGRLPHGPASGGWWSTARDLARWIGAQLAPRTDEAHLPVVVADPGLGAGYGLGWRAYRRGDHVHVGHGGLTNGFEARVELDKERGIGVAVLLNGIGPSDPGTRLAGSLFERAGDGPATAPLSNVSDDAAPADPHAVAGTYREVGFETLVSIEDHDGVPWMRTDGDAGGPLQPTDDPDTFRIDHGRPAGEPLVVLRRPDGTVDGLNIAGYYHARLPS